MSKNNRFGRLLTIIDYLNPFAGIHELYLIIKYYLICYRTLKSEEGKKAIIAYNKKSSGQPLRVDNIGRLYTVVNLPEEIQESEDAIMLVTLNTLREIEQVLLPLGITEIITPQYYKKLNQEKDTNYILIIINPNTSFFTIRNCIWELLKIISFIFLIIKIVWIVQ